MLTLLPEWLFVHYLVSVFAGLVVIGIAIAVLNQNRPTSTTLAWLLVVTLIPYLGVPLYLIFGARKISTRARGRRALREVDFRSHADEIVWLDDGVVAYRAFLAEIEAAKKSIRITTFVLGNDATGRGILEALTRKAREGVEVHLLLDDLLRFYAPRRLLKKLGQAGGHVRRFMPLLHSPFKGHANLRNHRKMAIFDGARAIVGGMNIAEEYMGPQPLPERWRDLSLLVKGEVVGKIDAIFCSDWEFASGTPLERTADGKSDAVALDVIPSGPDAPNDPIYESVLSAIFRAEKKVVVATPYFVPDEALMRALVIAARRDVRVCVVVPERSNHRLSDLIATPYLRQLVEAGVEVRYYLAGMLHAKAILVDDALAVVGSANFDMRSLLLNYEIALMMRGKDEVARLEHWFDETLLRTSLGVPARGWAKARIENVARLLAPLV